VSAAFDKIVALDPQELHRFAEHAAKGGWGEASHLARAYLHLQAAARTLADAASHCSMCRDCGEGPCCNACGLDVATEELGKLLASVST